MATTTERTTRSEGKPNRAHAADLPSARRATAHLYSISSNPHGYQQVRLGPRHARGTNAAKATRTAVCVSVCSSGSGWEDAGPGCECV